MTNAHASLDLRWPSWLVEISQGVRHFCEWVSGHHVLGIPLDWPFRLVFIGGLYWILRRCCTRRQAACLAALLLIAKELYDVFVHQNLLRPRPPNLGDVADIASGLAGLAVAMWLEKSKVKAAALSTQGTAGGVRATPGSAESLRGARESQTGP